MMIHPEGRAAFVEVPKTGSTACTLHLRKKGDWFQNGARGYAPLPDTFTGRHAYPTKTTAEFLDFVGAMSYGVVRNPWDRMASLWRASAPGSTTFIRYMTTGKFVHGGIDVMMSEQTLWLEHVDHVMKYESLQKDWDYAAESYGHLPPGRIEPINVSRNRAKPDWHQEEIDIVAKRFATDIETYGYTGPS